MISGTAAGGPAPTNPALAAVFVYGTLMPGHLRWGLIAPSAVGHAQVEVAGRLYDTGNGWPAARFAAPISAPVIDPGPVGVAADGIPGWRVDIAPAALDGLLAQLDEVEGAVAPDQPAVAGLRATGLASGRYRRVVIETPDGPAWAYEALTVEDAWQPIPAWADQHED